MHPRSLKIKLFAFALIFAGLLICCNERIFAQKKTPRFENYPAAKIYKSKIASLKLKDDDELWRDRFQWAIDNQKVNFAGHYVVTTWSCGSTCLLGAVIDAKTGRVFWWDVELNWDAEKPVEYRSDSGLIILSGCRRDNTGKHYFKIKNGRFVHLRSVLSKKRPPLS